MLESTKTLAVMELLTAGHLFAAKAQARSQTSQGSSPGLLVLLLVAEELVKLSREKDR
jgi:hypothetical protein